MRIQHIRDLVSWLLLMGGLGSASLLGQNHLLPRENGPGLEGPEANSYVLVWQKHPEAVRYEYVLTDNEFCFSGCAGDTRERSLIDTFTVEFFLFPGTKYYWTTRMFFADGDSSAWSVISSFNTLTPSPTRMLTVASNPLTNRQTNLIVDWVADEATQRIELTLRNMQGLEVWTREPIVQRGLPVRKQKVPVDWSGLPAGNYLLEVRGFDGLGRLLQREPSKILLR